MKTLILYFNNSNTAFILIQNRLDYKVIQVITGKSKRFKHHCIEKSKELQTLTGCNDLKIYYNSDIFSEHELQLDNYYS